MTSNIKYIGMDVHKESISIAVINSVGKVVMESVIETKASMILQFIDGLRGDLQVTFEEERKFRVAPHVDARTVCPSRGFSAVPGVGCHQRLATVVGGGQSRHHRNRKALPRSRNLQVAISR